MSLLWVHHSVQRTPVKEVFRIDGKRIYLVGTEYQSFGAGLYAGCWSRVEVEGGKDSHHRYAPEN